MNWQQTELAHLYLHLDSKPTFPCSLPLSQRPQGLDPGSWEACGLSPHQSDSLILSKEE